MHDTAYTIGGLFLSNYANASSTIVDLGSTNINGTLRDSCPKTATYIGLDMHAGPGVDIVIKPDEPLPLASNSADIVVASSVFEHDKYFWETFLEMARIAKPNGTLYINAPSNGPYHRYPGDHWRFYPDSGKALESWARRNGHALTLLESFIAERKHDIWNDFVAIFSKGTPGEGIKIRLLSGQVPCTNIWRFDRPQVQSQRELSEDMLLIKNLRESITGFESSRKLETPPVSLLARLLGRFKEGRRRGPENRNLIPHIRVAFPEIAARLTDPSEELGDLSQEIQRLLDWYVTSWPFAEDQYLQMYPDVAQAVRADKFGSAREHFRQVGYLEGRLPIKPAVDRDWYLETNPDVAAAVQSDPSITAERHFETDGYREGRSPFRPQGDAN